ncbi:hypothetical protein ACGFIG_23975 [Micromonospora sp. NPDC049048]|uniref:hypothetical protein n=1 Tax=Micromonospora sp. NPDC049048 TaxID=3364263 RepID=UPI00371B2214
MQLNAVQRTRLLPTQAAVAVQSRVTPDPRALRVDIGLPDNVTPNPWIIRPVIPRQPRQSSPNATPSRSATEQPSTPVPTRRWSPNGSPKPQIERARAEADLHAKAGNSPRRMSRAEITSLVTALGDIATVLRDADPTDKAGVYRQLGLGSPTSQKRKRCAPQWISARTVG